MPGSSPTRREFLHGCAASAALLRVAPQSFASTVASAFPDKAGDPSGSVAEASCPSWAVEAFPPSLYEIARKLDPRLDRFPTEIHAAAIEAIFALWSKDLARERPLLSLGQTLADSVHFPDLEQATSIPRSVGRPIQSARVTFPAPEASSRDVVEQRVTRYFEVFKSVASSKFEIFAVAEKADKIGVVVVTSVRYDVVGVGLAGESRQHTGTWTMDWVVQGDRYVLSSWSFGGESRSTLRGRGFSDRTHEMLAQDTSAARQLNLGTDHWRTVLDAAVGVDVYGNNGIAVGVIDGSGRDSVYVCQPTGLPNRLLRNRGDGTLEDITEHSGTGLLDGTASAIFADFFNRGMQELLVVRSDGPLLFRNMGGGKFELQQGAFHFATEPKGTFTSAAVGDYNCDGLLDIYLCVYSYYQGLNQYSFPTPYFDAQNGPPNFLFRNRGDGTFEDVTAASGMSANNNRFSFAAEWVDLREDGYPDLYVANDFGRKNLYRNHGDGRFTDDAGRDGVEDYGPGMSVNTLDVDGDGRLDLYVANMWLAEGKRITEQPQFLPDAPEAVRALYRKHNAGNSLYRNLGNEHFESVGERVGVQHGGWSWSCASWDLLHRGRADLYVANGFVTGPLQPDLQSLFWRQVAQKSFGPTNHPAEYEMAWNAVNELVRADYSWSGNQRNPFFLSDQEGEYVDVAGVLGLNLIDDSRAFALADLDGDGRLEVALKNRTGPQLRLLQNDLADMGEAVAIRLRGTRSNRDGIGALVTVDVDGRRQTRQLSAGSGFASQHSKELFFGLGEGANRISATVRWPGGATEVWHSLTSGTRNTLTEGSQAVAAEAFRRRKDEAASLDASVHSTSQGTTTSGQASVAPSSTWLVSPLHGPPLRAVDSAEDALAVFHGKRVAAILAEPGCEEHSAWLLEVLQRRKDAELAGLLFCLVVPSSLAERGRALANDQRVPLVIADDRSLQAWSVQLRYLTDRRRELAFPTTLLFDEEGLLVRLHRGAVASALLLGDAHAMQESKQAARRRAFPFDGVSYSPARQRDYFTYGVAFVQYGLLPEAETAFRKTVEERPDYAAAWFNLGTVQLNLKRYAEAETCLLRATNLDATDGDAWNNLGLVQGEQEKYDQALQSFEQAALANPANTLPVENMMRIYQFQNRPADAQAALQRLLARSPDQPELHLALGMSRLAQADETSGKAELERAIALRPDYTDALNDLATFYMRKADYAAALPLLERCLRADPNFDRALLNKAVLYSRTGKVEDARQLLRDFVVTHPDNQDATGLLRRLGG